MSFFKDLNALNDALTTLPAPDSLAANTVNEHQAELTKPAGSLGRLEALVAWLAAWQGRPVPHLDKVDVLVFAGNHGVTRRGVSAFPPEVTVQMVANFQHGGAAINQLCKAAGATLKVTSLSLETPTGDITVEDAMSEEEFLAAVNAGADAVSTEAGLICLGEMGIGNTTVAAALAAGLFGGSGDEWVGRGTGVDNAGLARKAKAVDAAIACHKAAMNHPLEIARRLGGREMAAIMGAALAARLKRVPVLLDGFVCTAAAAPLALAAPGGLDHAIIAHLSEESGHGRLARALGQKPLLDLGMRLGEASGAATAIPLLRAALACHTGMATFASAAVSGKEAAEAQAEESRA
ncbi:nicotinate-nucleotide--dimethylbenzimidazole phosphoribosyltransferase [Radicibacter daui]|uniref:nicotinate-nucleotide--dimethylbenzimidazole phosphoribosyltransferase n=1 Tax=Radicibacter daui TaxID=3064829 RepID=UPI004046AB49